MLVCGASPWARAQHTAAGGEQSCPPWLEARERAGLSPPGLTPGTSSSHQAPHPLQTPSPPALGTKPSKRCGLGDAEDLACSRKRLPHCGAPCERTSPPAPRGHGQAAEPLLQKGRGVGAPLVLVASREVV